MGARLLCLFALACAGTPDPEDTDTDTPIEADADTDADTDADADADTDTDADTDADTDYDFFPVVVTGLTGSVTYTTVLDGVPRCDLGIDLSLDTAAEDPDFRTWAAPVLPSLVRNDGDAACASAALVPEDVFFGLFDPSGAHTLALGFEPRHYDNTDELYAYTTDGNLDAELIAVGSGWKKDESPGRLTVDGWPPDRFAWQSEVTVAIPTGPNLWYDACGSEVPTSDTTDLVGTVGSGPGNLYPAKNELDVWSLVLTEADTVRLRATARFAGSAPVLWLNDAAGCTVLAAAGNVACNADEAELACPALVVDLAPGTYEVVVDASAYVGAESYELWSELAHGTLTRTQDDVKATAEQTYAIAAIGEVDVTWERE